MVGILSLLILAALLIGLVLGLIMWLTNGSKGYDGEMACGGCGYAVRGLETLNCPECGADLRKVGINRGQNNGSRTFGIVLTVVCGGILLAGCLGSAFFMFDSTVSSVPSVPVQQFQQATPSTATPNPPAVVSGPDAAEEDEAAGPAAPDQPAPEEPAP